MEKRGRKPGNAMGFASTGCRPSIPDGLSAVGLEAWERIAGDLEGMGLLDSADQDLMCLYAKTYELFNRVETELATDELALTCENGRKFINPLMNAYNNLATKLQSMLNDLGLSVKSRTKILVEQEAETSDKWAHLDDE